MLLKIIQYLSSNVITINLMISVINIFIIIYNWYKSRPRLEFYSNDNMMNIYKHCSSSDYHYKNSECIVFYYIKVFNHSTSPMTIGEFSLSVYGYENTISSKRVIIRDAYELSNSKGISGNLCIQMPLTIHPMGYCEGYIVFPFAPKYHEEHLFCEITSKATCKEFTTSGFIDKYSSDM